MLKCLHHDRRLLSVNVVGKELLALLLPITLTCLFISWHESSKVKKTLVFSDILAFDAFCVMLATSGKSLVVYLCLYLNFSLAQQSQSKIHIKNISYLGPQLSPRLSGLSRDGGASVLLNGHVVWLFDDTEVTSNDEELLIFVSNTAAYSHAPKSNLTLLDNFGISASGKQSPSQSEHALAADKSLSGGGWIPFAEDELAFNRQDPGNERFAICRWLEFFPHCCIPETHSIFAQGPARIQPL
jgi:hypothetical protein